MPSLKNALIDIIKNSGDILLRHYGKLDHIETKSGSIDLVTAADREAEEYIIGQIRSHFPEHGILAEESGGDSADSSEFRWVIDPLDGTTNFAHSCPLFCTSIGVQKGRETITAAVYNPYYRELFFAEKKAGAFLNQKKISVSGVDSLGKSLVTTGFAYDRRERADHYMEIFKDFMMRCHGVRRMGAAALDLCSVACGRCEGYWEENLKPWDTAAGFLILEEAGGRVTDFSGAPFRIEKKGILATNGFIHSDMMDVLSTHF